MGKLKKTLGVAAATAAFTLTGLSAANAINRVECTDNNYLWLSSAATTCWANAGTANVYLSYVYGYSSGNNAGQILAKYNQGGNQFVEKFAKNTSGELFPAYDIYQIQIY